MLGAGSVGFTRRLMMDVLAVPELRDTHFALHDIDAGNLRMAGDLCSKLISENALPATVTTHAERLPALEGADYVFCTVRVGGLEAFAHDVEIPLSYGVDQCVGDTLGPGGVFYALRTIPVLLEFAADMRRACPGALLLNYSNPMAMNCWALALAGGVRFVGLCHGVQGSLGQIAEALGVPREDVSYVAAGINHQTWFIDLRVGGRSVLGDLLPAMERHPDLSRLEPVRIDVLRRFGYYSTESNGHLSEYLAWYRKGDFERWICRDAWSGGETAGYLNCCRATQDEYRRLYPGWMAGEDQGMCLGSRSLEHGSYIIEALSTGRPYTGCFNVPNAGLIGNLPDGCIVELPCLADGTGIHPMHVGDLPPACAAVCRQSVSVQELAVRGALSGDRDAVRRAVLLDPLTGAVLSPDRVWDMVDEMFEAESRWLPQFRR